MKKIFIIANWKSNKSTLEAENWLQEISNFQSIRQAQDKFPISNEKEVIICPPFTLLSTLKTYIDEKRLPFKLGGQDVSPFGAGAYTGEINAEQIKEFADYAIIGHSERRNNFGETDELHGKKVKLALEAELTPIYCIQNENTHVPEGVSLVAYEPPTAIGTGNPDTPENAERVAGEVMKKYTLVKAVIYGGSVTSENVHNFISMPSVDGVLIGGASLDPRKFAQIIQNS